ncbi:unnamed protein product [Vitrella brassicaformis CCMP3155]|uniref:Uncharacterized protein n=1 Tax=Vitrella brassicaformis (strain CCMP3155) TaxID=1169540 RepID=A0A0G4GZV4_VITBC|nr:unnamed protein product [Vitrella brassicaformis CCMP3155]|eukprot:CEM36811.1 unnamed protein product [Vitrella brassicaformis CCMP3155]
MERTNPTCTQWRLAEGPQQRDGHLRRKTQTVRQRVAAEVLRESEAEEDREVIAKAVGLCLSRAAEEKAAGAKDEADIETDEGEIDDGTSELGLGRR